MLSGATVKNIVVVDMTQNSEIWAQQISIKNIAKCFYKVIEITRYTKKLPEGRTTWRNKTHVGWFSMTFMIEVTNFPCQGENKWKTTYVSWFSWFLYKWPKNLGAQQLKNLFCGGDLSAANDCFSQPRNQERGGGRGG